MRSAVTGSPLKSLRQLFFRLLPILLLVGVSADARSALAAETIVTKAPSAFLYEPSSGTILFAKEPDKPFNPGALNKIMTAATVFKALKDGDLTMDRPCKVSEHAWRTGGAPSRRGATMFAAIKSDIAVEDLLKGLLVHNANDAAIVLAECLDGSEQAFAGRMNSLAKSIGMTNSQFANPTGYPEEPSRTTVRDQARLAEYVIGTHADLYPMFALSEFTWNNIYQRNKNPLLGEIRGLDGLGAGNDETDGWSGLGSVNRNGRRVIAAVSGLASDNHRLQTLKEVIEGAWEYFTVQTLYKAGETVVDGRVFGGMDSSVPLVSGSNVDVLLPRGGTLDYRIRVVYEGPLAAPIEKGTPAGEIRVIGKDGIIYRSPLVTGAAVARGDMLGRALDGLQELLFGWIG
ncbi:D-alanyl-D-alanine carboxypeptidase family protein [Roseibium sp. M-1]